MHELDETPSAHLHRLETARLILRPWTQKDAEPFATMSSDPDVMKHLLPFASREAIDSWIERQKAHLTQHGFCFWVLESKVSGEFVGAAGLLRVAYEAPFTPAVEVGWRVARQFWGKGYAPEAAAKAIEFGFQNHRLPEIVANTVHTNRNSRRVMEKLGMSNDSSDDFDHPMVPINNPLRRQTLYRLRREDWTRLQSPT